MKMVRVVGVQRFEDRHGVWRAYYRRKGAPSVVIDASLTGLALAAEVERLNKLYLAPKAKAGTLRLLIADYKAKSNHWKDLRARTRKDYERVFKWLGASVDAPLTAITPPEVAKVRDKARDQHEPKFANQVVTTLKKVLTHGKEYGFVKTNAAADTSKATGGNKRANRPCTPEEANVLIDRAPSHLRPAIAIAIYTALRLGDVARLSKSADKDEFMETMQGKTRKLVVVPVCEDLRWILDGIPANNSTTVCVKEDGKPWAYEGIKTAFHRHRDTLEAEGVIGPGVTFHGLRHTAATILEENGFDETQTRHLLGHGPKSVSGLYGMSADRRALLTKMGDTLQESLRAARGNVAQIRNG